MNKLIIESKYLNILQNIFAEYCPDSEIWVYGSRIDGSAHSGSDLDLVVRKHGSDFNFAKLKDVLNESDIPFLIDINIFDELPKSFQQEILRNYIVLYKQN